MGPPSYRQGLFFEHDPGESSGSAVITTGSSRPDAELEKGIVTDQASYGKQIGRVVEALQAICENLDTKGWKPDQREALRSFLRMAEDLAQYKRDHQPVMKGDIAALVDAIRSAR